MEERLEGSDIILAYITVRRRAWLLMLAVISLTLLLTGGPSTFAQVPGYNDPQIDQANLSIRTVSETSLHSGKAGQTFIPAYSGKLTHVKVFLSYKGPNSGNVTLNLYETDAGLPTGTSIGYATAIPATANGWETFTLTTPAPITEGKKYAFVLESDGDFSVGYSQDDRYDRGDGLLYDQAGGSWATTPDSTDMPFSTVVLSEKERKQESVSGTGLYVGEGQDGAMIVSFARPVYISRFSAVMQLGNGGAEAAVRITNTEPKPPHDIQGPGSTVIAQATTTDGLEANYKWMNFTFSDPVLLEANKPYAIHFINKTGTGSYYVKGVIRSDVGDVIQGYSDGTYYQTILDLSYRLVFHPIGDQEEATIQGTVEPGMNSDGWYQSPVKLTMNAQDDDSGVKQIRYQAKQFTEPDELITGSTGEKTITDDGEHEVFYAAADNAGKVSEYKKMTFKIDKTAPELTGQVVGPPNGNGWFNQNVTISWIANDLTS
ncbi:MAG: DUF4082 domain-containing protein [Clostridia bacterium]